MAAAIETIHPDWQAGGRYSSPLYHELGRQLDAGELTGCLYRNGLGTLFWTPNRYPEIADSFLVRSNRFIWLHNDAGTYRQNAFTKDLHDRLAALVPIPTTRRTCLDIMTHLHLQKEGEVTMGSTAIVAPQNLDATRAAAVAIEGVYKVRQTQDRLIWLAQSVGAATERPSLLRLEIANLTAGISEIEAQMMTLVSEAKDDNGKKLYTNKESRDAAAANSCSLDPSYKTLMAALNDKKSELAKADAELTAITTEVGALKAVAQLAAAALNALGINAAA
jgi:hypothetical protein